MAGPDLVALPEGAYDDIAAQVGTQVRGETNGTGLRVGVACALFNGGITLRLLNGALAALADAGTAPRDITVAWAPGAFELPLVAPRLRPGGKGGCGAVLRRRHPR